MVFYFLYPEHWFTIFTNEIDKYIGLEVKMIAMLYLQRKSGLSKLVRFQTHNCVHAPIVS